MIYVINILMSRLTSKQVTNNQAGFTLLEVLVVTAILGVLIGVASNVFVAVLRSQNKTTITNEVRQNAILVIDLFERDVRSAESVAPEGVTTDIITLNYSDGTEIIWTCEDETVVANGYFTRQVDPPSGAVEYITNTETDRGVSIICPGAYQVTIGEEQIITLNFNIKQGVSAPQRVDYDINLPFETTVGTRVF